MDKYVVDSADLLESSNSIVSQMAVNMLSSSPKFHAHLGMCCLKRRGSLSGIIILKQEVHLPILSIYAIYDNNPQSTDVSRELSSVKGWYHPPALHSYPLFLFSVVGKAVSRLTAHGGEERDD
jgi:hypothetical protein